MEEERDTRISRKQKFDLISVSHHCPPPTRDDLAEPDYSSPVSRLWGEQTGERITPLPVLLLPPKSRRPRLFP